jgi:integrase
MCTMPRRLPPGCVEDRDRHGNVRVYYRPTKKCKKIRVHGTPWTESFMVVYEAAKGGTAPPKNSSVNPGTWRWICTKYMAESAEYKRLDERTKHVRKLILESTYDEPIAPGSQKLFRDMPLSRMTTDAVEVLRDRKIEFPEAANSRVKAIRQVFRFGVKKKDASGRPYAPSNPARDVEYFKTGSTGFHTWTVDEIHQYEERHPIGSKARLCLALLMFTGQRRSDIIRLGKQHARGGKLTFTQFKGRNRKPKRLQLPILPALQRIIDASPCGALTFLINDLGRPFTDAGIGNKMRQWCDEAGLPHCTAHGIRKAGSTIAAENGATAHQLMAIFGWDTLKQAEIYTKAANQKRLAEDSMHLIEAQEQNSTESGPTSDVSGTFSQKAE